MENRYQKDFTISSFELNPRAEARLTTVANYFQEIAYHHASRLKLGYDDMKERGTVWMLSRMRISMDSYPRWDDRVVVETWPSGIHKLFACREFRMMDSSGEELGKGSTSWLIVDLENHRPKRPLTELDDFFLSIAGEPLYEERLGKIDLSSDMKVLNTHRVLFSDLDIVGHVNNVKYMEWCIDAATEARGAAGEITDIEINFLHETRSGDEVEIQGGAPLEQSSDVMLFQGLVTGDNREAFRARIQWAD